MVKKILTAAVMAASVVAISPLAGCNGARDTALKVGEHEGGKGFMIRTLVRGDRQRKYGLFVPLAYNPAQKYPVIIFLHGMGEGGNDAHANLKVGLAPFVADRAENFPFICIFPQSPNGGWNENSDSAADAIAELDEVSRNYSIDQDRVSLTGLSTGGYGTWAIGAKYHDRFAALVPMGSSSMDMKDIDVLKNLPVRSYHNNMDMFAGVWNDVAMVNKLRSLGDDAQMTVYTALGHDCWETAYSNGELFNWLLQQRRKGATATQSPVPAPRSTSYAAPRAQVRAAAPALISTPAPAPRSAAADKMIETPY